MGRGAGAGLLGCRHVHYPRRGRPSGSAVEACPQRRGTGSPRAPAEPDHLGGRPGPGGRRRGHPADLTRPAADQRVPRRRARPVPDRRTGTLPGPGGRTAAVPGPADSGGGLTMSSELTGKTAAELSDELKAGNVSAVEVTEAHLDQIAATDDQVHTFLHVARDQALSAAADMDRRRAAGEELGPLAGVPVALKDVFTTTDMPTTAGSKILNGWQPPYDATITTRLRDAGAIILGKTNMDEFAMGPSTENSAFGPSHNPWDLGRIPGGSSGGSAAAVAAYEAPLAIGTDTGGAIRQPAAVCGIVGTKPTYGGSSRYGVVAFASSLDTPGPFGRTVLDAALLHEAMSGHDPCDSTSVNQRVPPVAVAAREGARADLTGVRVAVVQELGGEGYQPGVLAAFQEAVSTLRGLGATVLEVSCPHFDYALAAYYLIAPSECSSNLA